MKTSSVREKNYRNYVNLAEINARARSPRAFVEESEAAYAAQLQEVARTIAEADTRIVLLSGPSSSGKTTTTARLIAGLARLGVGARHVEMDNYFHDTDRSDLTLDLESPERVDMALLHEHLATLGRGGEVAVPYFNFATGLRDGIREVLRLEKDEIVIFEGIHALNDALYDKTEAHAPVGVYISARMRVTETPERDKSAENVIFEPEWTRFVRRILRDERSRGTDFARTQALWPGVRRGEVRWIMPFKHRAEAAIDSSLDYELCVLGPMLLRKAAQLDGAALREAGMGTLLEVLARVEPVDAGYVPEESVLREFIG